MIATRRGFTPEQRTIISGAFDITGRITPSRNRPSDTWSSSAACSASATGCCVGRTLTAAPTATRCVRPST
jgi:hypothetical protein